ncbi:MAG: relaxase MobL [Oscillospiraceae bacterium]|nr:relaxase MobL [Oscillospiraceae bacterium]
MKPSARNQKSYFMKYIATREGAESVPSTDMLLDSTKNQQRLIRRIINDFSDMKTMHEYTDYLLKPNRGNASEFIIRAIEENLDRTESRKNYMDYIANRPRTEKLGTHGLFTDAGVPVVLEQVADEVAGHSGNVWTNVMSLRREDAERLGYDNAEAWMNLIRSKRVQIAEHTKIPQEDLKWYASFHNESHHPHVHLVVYSTNPKKGYLTERGIESMRSMFARDIFKDDLLHIYKEQTELREEINEQAMKNLQSLIENMRWGIEINKNLENDLLLLAERLRNTGGKKVYGYLKTDVKAIINRIIDELAKTENVAKTYAAWHEMKCEVLRSYTDKMPELLPLSQQKELSKIRQIVINEAIQISDSEIVIEQEKINNSADENKYNADSFTPPASQGVVRLFHHLSRIFEDSVMQMKHRGCTDKKARSKEREKKIALGHAHDDYTPQQNI